MDKQMQIKIAALALAVILIVAIISLFAGGGELLAYASNDGMVVANSKSGKVIVKAKDTNADSPVITANKRYVVYKSGFTLYALRTKGGAKAVKLVDTVGSFTVSQNGSTVYYAPYQGQGIFSIRIGKDKKPVTEIKPSGFIVQNMHFAGNLLCAEKYIKDNVTGKLTEASISGYNLKQKNEKILVPFKAATASDPGVAPKIIGVTADRSRIYFFAYPEFSAMAADGVSLGWVDVKTSKSTIIPRTDFALLPFDGNVRIIENSTTKVAVSAGFGKNIGEDKKAGIYDTEKKAFNPISDTNLVSAYPATSADGKTFYYSAMQKGSAKANEFKGTRLYKVPAAGGKSDKFTQDSDFSDYAPVPVNGSVLFARQAKDMSLSIWTTKGGEPKKIADNVKALTNYYEYGYYNFDKIFTIHK